VLVRNAFAGCVLATAVVAQTAQSPQPDLRERIAQTLDRARPALRHHLEKADSGELALCCLAAVHDGMPRDDAVFAAALKRLQRADLTDTYGLALRLMVLAELPDFPARAELAERDTVLLLQKQTSGGFSYGARDGWWDLSNTQYAALGLRAAVALGQEVPLQRWRLLYQAVQQMQHDDGGFAYRLGQGRTSAYASMTAAGIAVLEVCAQQLGLDESAHRYHDELVAKAWAWLGAHGKEIGDRRTRFCYYCHYGLERAAILSGKDKVGDIDWYAAGARMLCTEQLSGGGWWGDEENRPPGVRSPSGHAVDTAFAVLFLRRKFQRLLPPVTGSDGCRSAALLPGAGDAVIRGAVAADTGHGRQHLPALLACLRSEVLERRKAAVLAIFLITGEDFGVQPYRDPAGETRAIRRAELWWLQHRNGDR